MTSLNYNIKMDGLRHLADGTSQDIANEAIDQLNDKIVARAQELVKVVTGATQQSIRKEGKAVVAGEGGLYLELGTVHMQAQPFLTPAFEEFAARMVQTIGQVLAERSRRW